MSLERLSVDGAVHALRPDFAVCARGGHRGRQRPRRRRQSEALLRDAEAFARGGRPTLPPHVAAWQDAYRAFGAKPQRTASSVDALWKRARAGGLPRVNWLVDVYNAVSVRHVLPVGGEDLARFVGAIRLVRAAGDEPFDTMARRRAAGRAPGPGEVVWVDDARRDLPALELAAVHAHAAHRRLAPTCCSCSSGWRRCRSPPSTPPADALVGAVLARATRTPWSSAAGSVRRPPRPS